MPYPPAPCFLIEQVGPWLLQRTVSMPAPHGCGHEFIVNGEYDEKPDWDDLKLPDACTVCGDPIDWDHAKVSGSLGREWERKDTGERHRMPHLFGPGAMWDAHWMPHTKGPDGRCLVVVLPNRREWMIDSEASNCTRKGDRTHQCWVRHGEPPHITVDKNGDTCAAGAGSIQAGDYHGFLRDGVLTAG